MAHPFPLSKKDYPSLCPLTGMEPGNHLCCLYRTDEEHRAVITQCIRCGLERNEKVLSIVDSRVKDLIPEYIRDDGIDPTPYLQSGQLEIHTVQEYYGIDGVFDPKAMIRQLAASTEAAVSEGYSALRVINEMALAPGNLSGRDRLIEYETLLNTFLPGSRCLMVCLYDRRSVPSDILLETLLIHPNAVIGRELIENLSFIQPDEFSTKDRWSVLLDHWIENLKERNRLIRTLTHEKEIAETYLDVAGVMMVALDTKGTVLMANQKTFDLLGIPKSDLIGENWFDRAIPERLREEMRLVHSRLIVQDEGADLFFDNPVLTKEGEERIIAWYNTLLRDDTGLVIGTLSSGEDVTELRIAEEQAAAQHEALLESEHRLSDIIDFLPDATFAIDENGVVIAWNHAIEEMTGVSAEEMIGQGEYAYALPFYGKRQPMLIDLAFKDDPALRSRYDLLKEMPDVIEAETRYARPRGEERTLWGRVSPLHDRQGRNVGAIETIRDITDRKQSEALVKESEIRYRRLFEAAKDGILILDEDDGTIIDANPFILEMLGYRLEELLGRTVSEIGFIHDTKFAEEAFLRLKEEGYIRYEDLPLETKDGRLMEVEFISNRYAINDHSVIQCNIRDITERKHAEAALRLSESLKNHILAAVPDILIRSDSDGRYLDILTPDDDRFILPKADLIGRTITDVTSEEIGSRLTEAIRLALSSEEMQTVEYTLTVPAGKLHFEARIVPYLKDEVIALIRDITDRKIAEEELRRKNEELATAEEELRSQLEDLVATQQQLRESEAYIRTVLDNLPIGIAVNSVDPEVNFEYFNENFFRIYRTTAEALQRADAFWDVVYEDPDFRSELRERVLADGISGDPDRMQWEDIPVTRKGEETTYISARNIPVPGKDLVISTVWDVTGRVEAEKEITHRLAFEQVISDISSGFVIESDFDVAINKALGEIGIFCGASRSYVFLIDPSGNEISNTHEWCADGVLPTIEFLQKKPTNLYPWWMERLRNGESIRIQSLNDLPREAAGEREILEQGGVTSLIVLPLFIRSRLAGFIGLDNVGGIRDWTEEDLHLLKITSELFGTAFEQKYAEDRILLNLRRIEALLELHGMTDATEQELFNYTLDAAPRMTQSRYAFIGLMNDDESVMTVHAWSDDVMNGCTVQNTPIRYPIASAGIWGECVRNRKPTVVNEYAASHPAKHGYPEGHVPITRYLGVPIFDGSRIVAVLAVANKEAKYRDDDIDALMTLGIAMWGLIHRRRFDAVLRESEEKYRSVSTLISDFAYSCVREDGGEYRIDWMVGAIDRISGYEINEVIAEGCWGFLVHPDDRRIFEEEILSLAPGVSSDCEFRIVRRDGGIRWLRAVTRSAPDEGGRSRIYGGCRDVTEEKTALLELEMSHARLESAMEAGGIAWWEMDSVTGDVAFSPRKAEMLGYSPDRFSHYTDFTDLIHPEDKEKAMQAMRDHLEGRAERYEVEYRIRNNDGSYLWLRDFGSVSDRGEGGAPLKVVGLVINITLLKEADEALRESEALLSTAGRITHFGGWSVNLAEQRVIWSDEVARIHGMDPGYSPSIDEEISYYAPEWKEKISSVFQECLRNGISYDEEMEIINATGERRWVRTTGEVIRDSEGEIVGIHGALQDITRKKEAEEAWKKAYAQIEENMYKFSILNDQIRNPLAVIMALVDLEGGEYADRIIEQVRLIDRIIAFLDQGVLESESTRAFMRKHDQLSS